MFSLIENTLFFIVSQS